jgi:hypothetical protein
MAVGVVDAAEPDYFVDSFWDARERIRNILTYLGPAVYHRSRRMVSAVSARRAHRDQRIDLRVAAILDNIT